MSYSLAKIHKFCIISQVERGLQSGRLYAAGYCLDEFVATPIYPRKETDHSALASTSITSRV